MRWYFLPSAAVNNKTFTAGPACSRLEEVEKSTQILIVEDEALVALSVKSCLEKAGYGTPWIASTAEEALRMLSAAKPDLILMDISLSGKMNGIEAAGIIRDTSRVPVVYLTAHSDPETLEKAKVTEPFGYILKPFDEHVLNATVMMALHKAAGQEETRRTKEELAGILRSIGDGIIVTSGDGVVMYVNSAARRLLGLARPIAPDTHVSALFPSAGGRAADAVANELEKVMRRGVGADSEDRLSLRGDGTRGEIDVRFDPFKSENGTVRGAVLTLRDVPGQVGFKRLVEKELENASDFHQSLIPAETLEMDGLRMHGFLIAAGLGSGDIYNVFRIDAGHLGVYMADVMGHGIVASSTTFLLSRLLTPAEGGRNRLAFLDADPLAPKQVVGRLNELFACAGVTMFFTMCYGVIDLGKKSLKLLRAGHPFPVIQRSGGAIKIIRPGGYAVGLSAHLDAPEMDYVLEPGDRFFFYTDGLLDCMDRGSAPFSEEGLISVIGETRGKNLQKTVSRIRERIVEWHGSDSFDDDVSLAAFELSEQ